MRLRCIGIAIATTGVVVSLTGRVDGSLVTTLQAVIISNGPTYIYQYTMVNDASSDLNAIALSIDVGVSAALADITNPTGWNLSYQPGDETIAWESSDPSFDLPPDSFYTFGFRSLLGPAFKTYVVLGLDETGTRFDFDDGLVLSPSVITVPEPASAAPAIMGAVFCILIKCCIVIVMRIFKM